MILVMSVILMTFLSYIWPNSEYWFGTDKNGHSLFDGVWYGARNSILISVIATFINITIGVVVGALWGVSKSIDKIMLEILQHHLNVPSMLIIIVLTYALGAGFWKLILAFCITGWIGVAFTIRVSNHAFS